MYRHASLVRLSRMLVAALAIALGACAVADEGMDGSIADGASDIGTRDGRGDATGDSTCASGGTLCGSSCVDLLSNSMNCGSCGVACPAGSNAAPRCYAGNCGIQCAPGFDNCDLDQANGCETAVTTATNCGACGRACPSGQVCAGGTCMGSCPAGQMLCASTMSCTDVASDPSNCGACGNVCSTAMAFPICGGGVCGIASCSAGYDDCDLQASTGCETRIANDPANCGACGRRCPGATGGSPTCESGVCRFSCNAGNHLCGGACVANDSPATCGASCSACPTPANSAATCASGSCGFTCNAGFADCDGNAGNGCEANLGSSPNCGACGVACGGSTPLCAPSGGSYACTGAGCPASMPTMCGASCVDLSSDTSNCGSCGAGCALANASASCAGGACTVTGCNPGFGNCDGNGANGCEVALQSDDRNCGTCGNACPAGSSCSGGACQCPLGTDLCGGSCVDLTLDRNNCGSCGHVCGGLQTCCCGICLRPLLCAAATRRSHFDWT